MFLVGLTGGIASGKTAVADLWESLGATVIDADSLAREVVASGTPGLQAVLAEFGIDLTLPTGELNRKLLAERVFSDNKKRHRLEQILHPLIGELSRERIKAATTDIVVYVIPLLVESKNELPFDFVVTVEAPQEKQIERMVNNRGMSRIEAENRVRAQASSADRANVSDRILNSNQELPLLLKDAKKLFTEIQNLASEKMDGA